MTALRLYVRWLRQARCKLLDDDMRVACAFDAAYVLLQDAARSGGLGETGEHPNASVIKAGSRALGVCAPDAKAGLRLLRWVDWARHFNGESPPYAASDALSWAERIKALYQSRLSRANAPNRVHQR